MGGQRTNESEGTRALLRNTRTSAFKIREVLDLVRGLPVGEARDILRFSERDAARLVMKLLDSAVANAENNDGMVPDELFVSGCFADEGRTYKTFRPRARGRAGRLRKRTAHVTMIVSRLPEQRLSVVKAKQERAEADRRTRRVAASQRSGGRRTRAERTRRRGAADQADQAVEAERAADVAKADEATAVAEDIEAQGIVDQQASAMAAAADADAPADGPSSAAGPSTADGPSDEEPADIAGAEDEEK